MMPSIGLKAEKYIHYPAMRITTFLFSLIWVVCSCNSPNNPAATSTVLEITPDSLPYQIKIPARDVLYDKVLGSLVGSAIGDAMGAPTEMWSRKDRKLTYGHVDALDPSFIDPSPEGLWDFHLPPGATTDDTRWKSLVGRYLLAHMSSFYQSGGPEASSFATAILDAYQQEVQQLKQMPGTDPGDIEYKVRRLTWLQEWAPVAEEFIKGDLERYNYALHRFYGGDLLCAGMLYAPVLGLPYPADPGSAYKTAYRLAIFDQGYARDITGLTAALVSAAMDVNATPESVVEVFRTVDPHDYFRSRLFGRAAFKTFRSAQYIVHYAKDTTRCANLDPGIQSIEDCFLEKAFSMLDEQNQHSPAHAQEILLVSLTAMMYHGFDFQSAMEFITNYGRDNDTSGAVTGAVLGAFHGFEKLPNQIKLQVVNTNKVHLGIDLEDLAASITDGIIAQATS